MHPQLLCKFLIRGMAVLSLTAAIACPVRGAAQAVDSDHIVSSQALQQQVVDAATTRQKNIDTLTSLLQTPTAQKAMRDAKADPVQVKNAIPTLSDEELSNLSQRVTKAQSDLAGGFIGIGLFTIIILVVILIIIIAVVH